MVVYLFFILRINIRNIKNRLVEGGCVKKGEKKDVGRKRRRRKG